MARGVQSKHVLAVANHFVLYNQETGRLHLSVRASDQALHELYLPPFEALVQAGVGVLMAAYDKVSGTYLIEHAELLTDELRTRMGFTGFVVSDWEATHSLAAVTSGLSVELPYRRPRRGTAASRWAWRSPRCSPARSTRPAGYPSRSRVRRGRSPTADPRRHPAVDGRVDYGEELLVGYRWYDATGNAALFPFGHGLSYTTFTCSDLRLSDGPVTPRRPLEVSVAVTNTGRRAGAEVVQLYVGSADALDGPPRQLRGFRRVELQPGQTRRVTFTLRYRDFCRWSSQARDWTAPEGRYRVLVGRSSADLPLRADVTVHQGSGPCAVTLDAPAEVSLGSGFTVSATLENLGQTDMDDLAVSLELSAGWMAEVTNPAPASIAGGATATASWLARAPSSSRTGPALLRVVTEYDADERRAHVESTARVTTSYPRLSASFDNLGIQRDGSVPAADFCGTGSAYLGAALARAGILPGRTVTCGSLFFTWPRVDPGQPDNVIANGQRIPISCAGKVLAFLGAASGGTATGVGTVTYVDGTTHPYAVVLPDWLANQASPGSQIVATVEQYRSGEVPTRRSVSVYAVAVPLLPGKAVTAFTLPMGAAAEASPPVRLHVFAVSIC